LRNILLGEETNLELGGLKELEPIALSAITLEGIEPAAAGFHVLLNLHVII